MKFDIFDTVRIKSSGVVGMISSLIDHIDETYAVNTGDDDNQPVCKADDLEAVNDG